MMRYILLTIFFSLLLHAGDGDKKIRLMGKVKEGISKQISVKNLMNGLEFVEEKVYSPYEKRTNLYGGILLNDLIDKYATKDVVALHLIALDDYEVVIPKKEWSSKRILLVMQVDKKFIGVSKKGPLQIVFPDYDSKLKEYQINLPMWIWMVSKLRFE